jgi:hypothetical protein
MDAGSSPAAPESGAHQPVSGGSDASESDDSAASMDAASMTDSQGQNALAPEAGSLEGGEAVDAASGGDGAAACPNAVSDLSSVGTGDFTVSFRVATTQTGYVALVAQRGACTSGDFWDIRMCAPDPQHRCAVAGSVLVETDSSSAYTALDSTVAINDGKPHDVAVARASGVLTITIDGVASGSTSSKASLASLPPMQTGTDACVGHDSTVALTGTLSNLCITTP